MQTLKGRFGIMLDVDLKVVTAEKRFLERNQEEDARKTILLVHIELSCLTVELIPRYEL